MRANATAIGFPLKGGHQSVTVSGTSAATSNAIGSQTNRVVLYSSTDCHIAFGASPTATTADFFLPASTMVMFPIRGGSKVAAIQASAGGTLHVSEVDFL